ncbi:MAG: hypothetical protein EYC70_08370 [Planctomycetota bacterium]|nr:MAG: hypothetical protein EYC70_08370 [Planctomycetota bacterium]
MSRPKGVAGRLWLRGRFRDGWLRWERGRIAEVRAGAPPRRLAAELADCRGLRVVPGFVDTLLHGYGGVDTSVATPAELRAMAEALARTGVTTALCGLYPLPVPDLRRLRRAYERFAAQAPPAGCRLAGWHIEGPFVAPHMRGALPPVGISEPTAERAEQVAGACGAWLRMCTFAPEVQGAEAAARVLRRAGVVLSIGHCAAGYEDCGRLAEGGDVAITHLGNRMPPLQAREPGPIGFALRGRARWTGVIPDGVHVSNVTLALLADTPELRGRLMFQSDNLSHAGLPALDFEAGGKRLHRDGPAARDEQGGLGGTLDPLPQLLAQRVREGALTWEQAVRGGCEVPGSLFGDCGRLEPEARADVLVLDALGEIEAIWTGGRALRPAPLPAVSHAPGAAKVLPGWPGQIQAGR